MTTLAMLRDYLHSIDAEKAATLGDSPRVNRPDGALASRRDALVERLKGRSIANDRILIVIVALYVLLFAGSAVLVFVFAQRPAILGVVLGGDFLSLGTVVFQLRLVWREKNMLDMLVCVLPEVAPTEAAKIIQAIYFKQINTSEMSVPSSNRSGAASQSLPPPGE